MKSNRGLIKRIAKNTALAAGALLISKAVSGAYNKNRFHLNGKVVLITGGSRGLGLILARQLAEEGARVVICARSEESLQRASVDLASRTTKFLAIPCDITDEEQVRYMIRQIKEEMGPVDVLINNAGIIQVGPIETMSKADYESALGVHFRGPFNLISEVLPDMKKRRRGRIVNIVSIGGKVSFPHLLPYNTSKFALSGFSEGLSAELWRYNIRLTTVYPGLMRTGSPENIDVKGQHEKEYAWFKIMDSLPLLSMNADRAARQIINAMKKGSKTITLSVPAKLAIAVHGIAPGLTITLFGLVNLLLPDPAGTDDKKTQKGYESESLLTSSFLTKKTDEAAVENLEQYAVEY
ncbi:MAG: SDR family oxidoreductase [Balneolaceae bacterium]